MLPSIKVKQLTPEEEVALIKIVLKGKELSGLLSQKKISAADYERMQQESMLARDKLVTSNLPYVIRMAQKYRRHAPIEELVSVGTIGLLLAVNHFDPAKSPRFLTFAGYYIVNEMLTHINSCNFIPIPQSVRDVLTTIEATMASFLAEHFRLPTTKEIADITGIPEYRVADINKHIRVSQASKADSDELLTYDEQREFLQSQDVDDAVSTLESREQEVVRMYYGLRPYQVEHTLQQIGNKFGLTRERVRQIRDSGIEKIMCLPSIMKHAS